MKLIDVLQATLLAFISCMAVVWAIYNLVPYYGIVHGIAYPAAVLILIAMMWFNPRAPHGGLTVVVLLVLAIMALGAWEAAGARDVTVAGQLFTAVLIPLFFLPLLYTAVEKHKEKTPA
ncbi:hypothetical protein [Nocardiopsis alba]|uniref:hypothetical protein n=1 Tax=Nocardiopsis alba TaxID=53437 RepID=UPI0036308EFD